MKLTDKALKDFNEWYNKEKPFDLGNLHYSFYSLDLSMQIGVYELFFDTENILISVRPDRYSKEIGGSILVESTFYQVWDLQSGCIHEETLITRAESWEKAIEKANEIYNK